MNYRAAVFWLFLNILTIVVLSFYSMMEMAAVSFNKVRLQYYVAGKIKQAVWLNYLLHNPSRLFGTTLILVNIATIAGSEFSREFHEAIGVNPDFSVITQVILVVIFGELSPMFAARRYPEHVVMLGIPLVYISAKLMTPFLWILGLISKTCNLFIGGDESKTKIFLSQEELLKILETGEEKIFPAPNDEYDTVAVNILNLHKKDAKEIMNPLEIHSMLASNATVFQAKKLISKSDATYLIMYHHTIENIIGILFPRDLIRATDTKKARDFIQPPWFITEFTKVLSLLNQFRTNNKSVAIVLNKKGLACGFINLDDVMEEIFGKTWHPLDENIYEMPKIKLIVERSFPGTFTVAEFKDLYHVSLDAKEEMTLGELIKKHLGSHPEVGESIYIAPFEITVKETSLTDIKKVSIHTRLK